MLNKFLSILIIITIAMAFSSCFEDQNNDENNDNRNGKENGDSNEIELENVYLSISCGYQIDIEEPDDFYIIIPTLIQNGSDISISEYDFFHNKPHDNENYISIMVDTSFGRGIKISPIPNNTTLSTIIEFSPYIFNFKDPFKSEGIPHISLGNDEDLSEKNGILKMYSSVNISYLQIYIDYAAGYVSHTVIPESEDWFHMTGWYEYEFVLVDESEYD